MICAWCGKEYKLKELNRLETVDDDCCSTCNKQFYLDLLAEDEDSDKQC